MGLNTHSSTNSIQYPINLGYRINILVYIFMLTMLNFITLKKCLSMSWVNLFVFFYIS